MDAAPQEPPIPALQLWGKPCSRPGLAAPLRFARKLLSSFSKYVLTPLLYTKNPKLILLLIKFISKDYLAEEK